MIERHRNFTFIVYPDDVPANWVQILEELAVPAFISPLHNLDIVLDTGEFKKPHYHVVLMFGGKKSIDQVLSMLKPLGIKYVDIVCDLRGCARYLCHLDFFDRPDKRLYDPALVVALGGACYQDVVNSPSDRHLAIQQMSEFLIHNDINELWEFWVYCYMHQPEWYQVLRDSDCFLFEKLLKSKRFMYKYTLDENGDRINEKS